MSAAAWQALECFVGYAYLAATISTSLYFLHMAKPYYTNDLWWPQFTNDTQAFVATLFNAHLTSASVGSTNVPVVATPYSIEELLTLAPSYTDLVLNDALTLESAIENLHLLNAVQMWTISTQYCWLDFAKRWHMAHTRKRQDRCLAREVHNGAVYLDAILRNVIWSEFAQTYESTLATIIGTSLQESNDGREWWRSVQHNQHPDVVDEARYWRSWGVQTFTLQWHNMDRQELTESVQVGSIIREYSITIKRIPYEFNGNGWTSWAGSWGIWNDVRLLSELNVTMLGSMTSNFSSVYDSIVEDTPVATCVRGILGPYLSLDMKYVGVPQVLRDVVASYNNIRSASDAWTLPFDGQAEPVELDPLPHLWLSPYPDSYLYYGGNPLCVYATGKPYVQLSFGFADSCSQQMPYRLNVDASRVEFALAIANTSSIQDLCRNCGSTSFECMDWFTKFFRQYTPKELPQTWHTLVQEARTSLSSVYLVQFALTQPPNETVMMRQQVVSADLTDPWNVYGWMFFLDWVAGHREVIQFEGDVGALSLITDIGPTLPFQISTTEIPSSLVHFLWSVSVYASSVLATVAALVMAYSLSGQFSSMGRNLLHFNRIAGSVWVGRLVIVLRAFASAAILSTIQVDLVQSPACGVDGGHCRQLVVASRPLFDTIIIAGESLWGLYALHDVLLLMPQPHGGWVAWLSMLASWTSIVVIDVAAPISPVASVQRQCTNVFGSSVHCCSGILQVGTVHRMGLIFGQQLGWFVVARVFVYFGMRHRLAQNSPSRSLHLPAAALGFMTFPVVSPTAPSPTSPAGDTARPPTSVDKMACVLSGLLPFEYGGAAYVLDIKLWTITRVDAHGHWIQLQDPSFERVQLSRARCQTAPGAMQRVVPAVLTQTSLKALGPPVASLPQTSGRQPRERWIEVRSTKSRRAALSVVCGCLYIIGAVAGGIVFVSGAHAMLENDLFWSNLETSSTRAILYNWFHQNLFLASDASSFSTLLVMDLGPFNESNSASVFSSLYPSKVQYEVMTTLVPTIQGLRRMDGCDAAWIFTAYCWLDFNKVWSMANSPSRQRRCTDYQARNGAVYLEAVLRNVNWDQWTACWGDAFSVGIKDTLLQTSAGQAWLAKLVADSTLTASQEAAYWSDYGITRFTTQWQNFKSIGLVETFEISMPLQTSYTFTIKSVASEMHVDKSSSFKLYWGLANDLNAIMSNTTSVGGQSLLRNTANYAFQNVTLGTVLVESGVVESPRGQWLDLVESTLGPFGSIDARHIACPFSLVILVRRVHEVVTATILSPPGPTTDLINVAQTIELQSSWPNRSWQLSAGNILCDDANTFGAIDDHTLKASFTTDGSCGGVKSSFIYASQFQILFAGLAWHVQWPREVLDVNAVCDFSTNACLDAITNSIKWIQTVVTDDTNAPRSLVRAVVRDAANVSVIQFEAVSQQLVQLFLFQSGAQVDYTGWLLLYDWAIGVREVVAFVGDSTQLTVLSDYTVPAKLALTSNMVLPQRLTHYARYAMMYSSAILALIGLATCCTVVVMARKGHLVESGNLFLFNRVAGMVWVGRPLLYLRGVVAIALLSAASMEESRHGMVTVLSSATMPDMLQTLVRSIEVCWLVFVTQDVLTLGSDQYTYVYASKASLLVVGVTFLLSLDRPVRPVVTVGDSRVCEALVVDFELACRSGELAIGSFSRAISLCSLVVGSICLCYFLQSFHRGRVQRASSSLFLSSSANHFFTRKARWTWNGVHYVDRASALLAGLVVFWTTQDTIHFLDIKTWRLYVIPRPSVDEDSSTVPPRFTHSIPMLG